MTVSKTLCITLFIGALCSLGCLVPGPDFFEPEDNPPPVPDKQGPPDVKHSNNKMDQNNVDPPEKTFEPSYDPNEHDRRDNPDSNEYRGQFKAEFTQDEALTLDAYRLGEATYSLFDYDGLTPNPHCLLSLIDRRQDKAGRLGYILFKLPVEVCSNPSQTSLEIVDEANAPDGGQNVAIIKAIQLEKEDDEGVQVVTYHNLTGSFTISDFGADKLRAMFTIEAKTKRIDDGRDQNIQTKIEGGLDAVYLKQ